MNQLKENYRNALEKALRDQDPSAENPIETVINRVRQANENMIARKSAALTPENANDIRALFDRTVEEFKLDHSENNKNFKQTVEHSVIPYERKISFLNGLMLGSVAVAGILLVSNQIGFIDIAINQDAKVKHTLYESYLNDSHFVQIADEYLIKATKRIKDIQKEDPELLSKATNKKFVSIQKIDKELFDSRPRALTGSENIIVQADSKGYKVLMNSNLCNAISIENPEMRDPKRLRKNRVCTHFGYWNEAGKNF